MEQDTTAANAPPHAATKRVIERSASQPGITLEEAIPFVQNVAKYFPGTPFIKREDIAAILKTKANNIIREVAAAAHYTLLKREKDAYQITDAIKILNHSLGNEKAKLLLECFAAPKLYSELIQRFDGHAIPPEFKTILIRFYKITERAAPEVEEIFLKNARFVGALSEHGILNYKRALSAASDNSIQYAEVTTEDTPDSANVPLNANNAPKFEKPAEQPPDQHDTFLPPETINADKIKIPLSEKKFAYLLYPTNIKIKDIEILRKQIDLLELLIE